MRGAAVRIEHGENGTHVFFPEQEEDLDSGQEPVGYAIVNATDRLLLELVSEMKRSSDLIERFVNSFVDVRVEEVQEKES